MDNTLPELTLKAKRTRQHILETALNLFVTQGYEATTMRDIASAADCSLGLTYRYFARKEELVLAVYWQMASETSAQIEMLSTASIAERFYQLMGLRLNQAAPYRSAFRALFGATLHPDSGINILGANSAGMRDQARQAFGLMVSRAADAPPESLHEDVTTLVYSVHFAVILFWLYDRSPDQRTTFELLAFIRDMLALVRKGLSLPFIKKGVIRLAGIMESVFVQP
jgi:AcrR family transcriptional regulator